MKLKNKIRYAVVGQGYISQIAVLPAFRNARNSQLTALVSGEPRKLKELGRRYGVKHLYSYDEFDECLRSGEIDAIYLALPNDQHRDFAIRASRAGIHVLCEKPMAISSADCQEMIAAAQSSRSRLMVAYRLHFEAANLAAIAAVKSGRLGDPRLFTSVFSLPVKEANIRTRPLELGGGPLYDIGIYCINAARYLFRDEPIEAFATSARRSGKAPFREVDEAFSVTLRFPKERLANFVCSFGAASAGSYQLVGTRGDVIVGNAFELAGGKRLYTTVKEKTKIRHFEARDQFAPLLIYFSDCILKNRKPEPSGIEGLADVRIIEAILQSAKERRPVAIHGPRKLEHPEPEQVIRRPSFEKPELTGAEEPSADEAA
ncbi:MAG: Gfo/Idh/MocA family oxidoreductase [Oligoflexia bacterium]|nr:Gfo/Idh/MocA family oxidoreductase [Oligoflexia bacterium]